MSARVAVVGHVEFVEFIRVKRLPAAREVVEGSDSFTRPAGGGGVAAGMLAEMGAAVELFTALGDDDHGRASIAELRRRGVAVHAVTRAEATRRAVTLLESGGERAIVTIGERLHPRGEDRLPWELIERCEAVYFTAGDAAALRCARRAPVLVASPRAGEVLESGPVIDALIYSSGDPVEVELAARSAGRPRIAMITDGARGGSWHGESSGRWDAVAAPGPIVDAYGCGDTFAAGVALALGRGETLERAAAFGAEWGARCLTRAGAP